MSKVYWIHPVKGIARPTLALVQRPRPGKLLLQDLTELREAGIKVLVSLIPGDEAKQLGLSEEAKLAEEAGLEFCWFPMADHKLPRNVTAFRKFAIEIATRVFDHEAIGIHCQGSIGRSTLVAACALIHLGWTPAHALVDITNARGCPVPDTEEQQEFILHYEPEA